VQQGIIEVVNPEVLVIFLCCWYEFVVWGRCSKPNYDTTSPAVSSVICHRHRGSWTGRSDSFV